MGSEANFVHGTPDQAEGSLPATIGDFAPQLKQFPERNICFFNIAGGAATDSINTLILIQESDPELLKERKIEINILDIDTYGPDFAKRCIDGLKQPGNAFMTWTLPSILFIMTGVNQRHY